MLLGAKSITLFSKWRVDMVLTKTLNLKNLLTKNPLEFSMLILSNRI